MLGWLQKSIMTKHTLKLTKVYFFYQDHAPVQTSLVSMAVVRDCGFELVNHLPYSLDLTVPQHEKKTHVQDPEF